MTRAEAIEDLRTFPRQALVDAARALGYAGRTMKQLDDAEVARLHVALTVARGTGGTVGGRTTRSTGE